MIILGKPAMSRFPDSIFKPKCPMHEIKVKCFFYWELVITYRVILMSPMASALTEAGK